MSRYIPPIIFSLFFGFSIFALCISGCDTKEDNNNILILTPNPSAIDNNIIKQKGVEDTIYPYAGGSPQLVYVNLDGVTITIANSTDSKKNTIDLPEATGGTIAKFNGDQTVKNLVIQGLKTYFKAFNIKFITSRPTEGDYHMAIIGGTYQSIGYPETTWGLAPINCNNSLKNQIAFVFSENYYQDLESKKLLAQYPQYIARAMAHELGHLFGLHHCDEPCDLMVEGNSNCDLSKMGFQNKTMNTKAETGSPLPCFTSTINTYQVLVTNVGLSDQEAPKVQITAPANNAEVEASFNLEATITDNQGVTKVELLVDNALQSTLTAPSYRFPLNLGAGQHTLTIQAYDDFENKGTASLTIIVKSNTHPNPDAQITTTNNDLGQNQERTGTINYTGGCSMNNQNASQPDYNLVMLMVLLFAGSFIFIRSKE